MDLTVHVREDGFSLVASVFSEDARDNFEGSAELLNSVLVEAGLLFREFLDVVSDVEFGSASTGNEARISNKRFNRVDTIVDCALDIVELSVGCATENNSSHFVFVTVASENSAPSGGDFLEVDLISVSHLIGGRALQFNDRGSTASTANTLEFPLGHNLDSHHSILLKVVDSELGHGALANNTVDTSFSELLDPTFKLLFLTSRVVKKIISVFQ